MPEPIIPVRFSQQTPGVRAFYTTRHGGVSREPFASLNCGFSSGDDPDAVRENRRRALDAARLPALALTIGGQVHGRTVAVVDEAHRGRGAVAPDTVLPETDGLLTDVAETPLGITTADCVPVLLAASDAGVVGALHAGWRGVLGGILQVALEELAARWQVAGSAILVAFGPAICMDCFEIQRDVADQAVAHPLTGELLQRTSETHWRLDLRGHLVAQCEDAGIPRENIAAEAPCSKCSTDTFFSYRAEGPRSGRTLSCIALTSS